MAFLTYYCRGKCSKETFHEIENFVEDQNKGNFAKLQCIKCPEPAFVVEYSGAKAPTKESKRVGGLLIDEDPTDIVYH